MSKNIFIGGFNMKIIGVTGYLGSGKDTVADYFKSQGYEHISLSDILRSDLKRAGKEATRDNLQNLGNELRQRLGGNILAERAKAMLDPEKNYVITSIGRADEIDALKGIKGFKLIFVDALPKLRYERQIKRGRLEDKTLTLARFLKDEEKERKGGGAQFREFDNIKKKADYLLTNNSTKEALFQKTEKIYKEVNKRPNWDEYFFGIMNAVATRATCDRGKCAAIVVRDNVLLATGYVGAPRGLPSCDEVGHLMEKTLHDDGVERMHCVRTIHAEQNAILQAANNGVALKGAKIYVKMAPCPVCANMLINAGIKEVVCMKGYQFGQRGLELFKQAGVKITVVNNEAEKY
jgi:dCMP deaminase